jgi:uncharacterized protein (TIGR03083 family)
MPRAQKEAIVPDGSELVELMRVAFAQVDDAVASLADEAWAMPTECPGWDVRACVSHLCGTESWLLGRARPEPRQADHVRNDMGARNEGDVAARRELPPADLVAEFRELTSERIKALEALPPDAWRGEAQTPAGPGDLSDLISIRILDLWYHEQDIRRAVHRPGNLDGPVARFVASRIVRSLPVTVGKRVAPPDGTVVWFDITTPPVDSVAFQMTNRRAMAFDTPPERFDVKMSMTSEALLRLCGGRWDVDAAVADGRIAIDGDSAMARDVVGKMAVTP